jgi:hypothetical protein
LALEIFSLLRFVCAYPPALVLRSNDDVLGLGFLYTTSARRHHRATSLVSRLLTGKIILGQTFSEEEK